jgi:hypothetical protein
VHTSRQVARISVAFCCSLLFAASAAAATLSGTVTNRTTGKPSSGDTIALINTAQGMDEIAKASSDAQGKFQMNAPDGGQILLHITHAGADYFKSVSPGTANVDIDVYDSAAKVAGITGEALVFRAETDLDGKTLHVSENFFLQNASMPPRTQFGGNTFEFFLPAGAQITQSVASAPNGLPTNVDVKTLDTRSGHYAFTFPLRPGETRFQIGYTMPYTGTQSFSVKLSVPTGDVAVMLPKSMQFQTGARTQFQSISPDINAQSYDAHNPPATQPIEFSIAGTGQMPQQTAAAPGQDTQAAQGAQASTERPGGGMAPPGDPDAENDPWSKYKWWIVGLLGLGLAGGAGVMLKKGQTGINPELAGDVPVLPISESRETNEAVSARPASSTLQALKDELFELEIDRVVGKLTPLEYAEHKAALDVLLRRALSRIEPGPNASNE